MRGFPEPMLDLEDYIDNRYAHANGGLHCLSGTGVQHPLLRRGIYARQSMHSTGCGTYPSFQCCTLKRVVVQNTVDHSNGYIVKFRDGIIFDTREVWIARPIFLRGQCDARILHENTIQFNSRGSKKQAAGGGIPVTELISSKAGVALIARAK